MEYKNYGDVNPIEHGGIWVKQINDNTFEIIRNIPEQYELHNMEVNITDSWIEPEGVMSYIGMTDKDFNALWFAIGCTMYYGVDNFGSTIQYESEQELIEGLKCWGITAE